MKITRLIAQLAAILVSSSAVAGHAIYKVSSVTTALGNGLSSRVSGSGFFIYDPDTKRTASIPAFTVNGMKLFSVSEVANLRVDQVSGPRGASYTVISQAESPNTQFAGVLSSAAWNRGLNVPVVIDGQGTRLIPKIFSGISRSVAEQPGFLVASEVSGKMTLDVMASRASNLSETFDQAVARIVTFLISKGYTQLMLPPAE
jgi:hypothetical protein